MQKNEITFSLFIILCHVMIYFYYCWEALLIKRGCLRMYQLLQDVVLNAQNFNQVMLKGIPRLKIKTVTVVHSFKNNRIYI